jgi:hypothetical protein
MPVPVFVLQAVPQSLSSDSKRKERETGLHVGYASSMPYGLKAMRPTIMLTMPTRPTVARCLVISVLPSSSSADK